MIDVNAAVNQVWLYIGQLLFNILVLVGAVKMSDRIIVTFDKSQEDIPVLMSFRENSFVYLSNSPAITVINTITGNEAIEIWNRLTKAGVKNDD